MNCTANKRQNWTFRNGFKLSDWENLQGGGGFKGRTTQAANEIRTRLIKPTTRRDHRMPKVLLMASTMFDITRPPKPLPLIAMPTAIPRRFEKYCWGALIHGNQANEAPKPALLMRERGKKEKVRNRAGFSHDIPSSEFKLWSYLRNLELTSVARSMLKKECVCVCVVSIVSRQRGGE
jgi:hypothetical protein